MLEWCIKNYRYVRLMLSALQHGISSLRLSPSFIMWPRVKRFKRKKHVYRWKYVKNYSIYSRTCATWRYTHFCVDFAMFCCFIVVFKVILLSAGEDLLNGSSLLQLPANVVVVLNSCFEHIRDFDLELSFETLPATTHIIPNMQKVQLLFDFAQKLKKLRVKPRHD